MSASEETTPLFLQDAQMLAQLMAEAQHTGNTGNFMQGGDLARAYEAAKQKADAARETLLGSLTPDQKQLYDRTQNLMNQRDMGASENEIQNAHAAFEASFEGQSNQSLYHALIAAEKDMMRLVYDHSAIKRKASFVLNAPKSLNSARLASSVSLINFALIEIFLPHTHINEKKTPPFCQIESFDGKSTISFYNCGHDIDMDEVMRWLKSDELRKRFEQPKCLSQVKIAGQHTPGIMVTGPHWHEGADPVYNALLVFLEGIKAAYRPDDMQYLSEVRGAFIPTQMTFDSDKIDRQAVICTDEMGKEMLSYFAIDPRHVKPDTGRKR